MSNEERPAYFVVCAQALDGTPDPRYGEHAAGPAAKAQLTPVAMGQVGDQVEVLEGALPEGTTLVAVEKFRSMEALKEFYYSEGYQKAIPFRKDTVKMHFIAAVPGVTEADLAAMREAATANKN